MQSYNNDIIITVFHILKRKMQLKQTNVTYAVPSSNKVFNSALRRKCLPTPGKLS